MDKTSPSGVPNGYQTMWSNRRTGTITAANRIWHEKTARNQALKAMQGDSYLVYAIRLTDDTVKIGCTSDLAQRIRSYPGCEVLAFRTGDFADEKAIHAGLVAYRARGHEYYHPTSEVLAVVNDMRSDLGLPLLAA